MAYQIEYAYVSHTGFRRVNNEDNFWCLGDSMPQENTGTGEVRIGRKSLFGMPFAAVFDGMGGESAGEAASYIGAQTCGYFYMKNKKKIRTSTEAFLTEMCGKANEAVCRFAKENRIGSMGSTLVSALFAGNQVYVCNLGDSPCYLLDENGMEQISVDHVLKGYALGKPPLTQYIGIEEESMVIEPDIRKRSLKDGMKVLLCSDGLTDMVHKTEIEKVLREESNIGQAARLLLEKALENGGKDNVTIILCSVINSGEHLIDKMKAGCLGMRRKTQ